eukprot:TRINITY_DN3351_c0_g1_i3.p3 TRINITY_DN3351_c0_g1~~TRINITY_DN3351_c0_g1_i3.p3  ORF type:complete len:156 (-),score=36.35 TRINITY_DN3351_c0_g1_i3:99-566(-)
MMQSVSVIKDSYAYEDKYQSSFEANSIENQFKIEQFFQYVMNEDLNEIEKAIQQNDVDYLCSQNSQGLPALHFAIDNEKTQSFEFLLDFYSQRNLINLVDKHGMNALYYAVLMENVQAVKQLLEKKADPFLKDHEGKFPVEEANHEIKQIIFSQN